MLLTLAESREKTLHNTYCAGNLKFVSTNEDDISSIISRIIMATQNIASILCKAESLLSRSSPMTEANGELCDHRYIAVSSIALGLQCGKFEINMVLIDKEVNRNASGGS